MEITADAVKAYLESMPEGRSWDIWDRTHCLLARMIRASIRTKGHKRVIVDINTFTYYQDRVLHECEVPLWYRLFLKPYLMSGKARMTREEALKRLEEMGL